jgi:hypothetical protein
MENTVTTSRVAAASDGPLRPAVSATGPRTTAVRAVEGLAMTTDGRCMQQGLAPSIAEGLVPGIVKARALRVLPSRILSKIEPISGRKHTELNRQTRVVERLVSYRKQTTATCSNRQKIQKWTSTFLPEIVQARMLSFSLRSRQTILPEGGKL